MPRPKTKQELTSSANAQFEKLWETIDAMDEQQQNANFQFGDDVGKEAHWKRDQNIRDVLIHLYEWHELFLAWVNANQNGDAQPFLPAPYNWKTYGDMNVVFWEKHQNTPYEKAREMVRDSHASVMQVIETFSDEALFTKKYFTWTGGSTLGDYGVSVTVGHYNWAIKKVKKHIKTVQK